MHLWGYNTCFFTIFQLLHRIDEVGRGGGGGGGVREGMSGREEKCRGIRLCTLMQYSNPCPPCSFLTGPPHPFH